jgi:ketosteroid isomerase-like protein
MLLLAFNAVDAQNANPLVKAEIEFQQAVINHGIRDGFLAYVDSSAIVYTGEGLSNAKKFWASLPQFDGIFLWFPDFAEMSLSGDWGYTTGNYEHKPKLMSDPATETGQYSTVWHKTKEGEWKYLIDIGNQHPKAAISNLSKNIQVQKIPAETGADQAELFDLERRFGLALESSKTEAYHNFGSENFIFNLDGYPTIQSAAAAAQQLETVSVHISYHAEGTKISGKKDLAAVYGSLVFGERKGNYLRIWRHEPGGWKIALEAIHL